MIAIQAKNIDIELDESKLARFRYLDKDKATQTLAELWDVEVSDVSRFLGLFVPKNTRSIDEETSFVTLAFNDHGYVVNPDEVIDVAEAKKQIDIDLEIINRESQWDDSEAIVFKSWWPAPTYNSDKKTLTFGVVLGDKMGNTINRTMNRLILSRYGHIELNYSLAVSELDNDKPIEDYLADIDNIEKALSILAPYRYDDIDEDNDYPSKSRPINLVLSAEIF